MSKKIEQNKLYFNGKKIILCISRITSFKALDKEFPIIKDMGTGKNHIGNDDLLAAEGYKEITNIIKVETQDG